MANTRGNAKTAHSSQSGTQAKAVAPGKPKPKPTSKPKPKPTSKAKGKEHQEKPQYLYRTI
ncbi:hypothetical protein M405DRAFT_865909 [Rhizopogon salebrosus TDB-379]|nr:hypothetical protein M405DRAFT_865909 [Rhizopogon salebrosus TDB-379]